MIVRQARCRQLRRSGAVGCADDRWLRESGGHPSVSEKVRAAILAVREETRLHRSKVDARTRETMIHRYVRETFPGQEIKVPSYDTLRRVRHEWFGPGRGRQRYERSASLPEKDGHVLVTRPGQVVALDATILPVMVREGVFGDPVRVHLTPALDVYTHSICAFRLTLVSDASVDVAMVLRDVMLPLPMRADGDGEMEWPYPGLPAAVVAEFVGHRVAALPFFAPETVTTDHGSVYRNHHLVEVQEVIGCRVLPARVLRPQDVRGVELGVCRVWLTLLARRGVEGHEIRDEDIARPSPLKHRNRIRTCSAATASPPPPRRPAPCARCATRRRRSRTRTTTRHGSGGGGGA
ncbi:hypothetical protein [Kitasatospora sp. NPDC101183]|uniref:hypothetical protein n=1 Tax=Kitasatospora sp. NPDC101183 TaxID=3364100 RepID=UPI00380780ED